MTGKDDEMGNYNRAVDSAEHRNSLWAEALDIRYCNPVKNDRARVSSPRRIKTINTLLSSGGLNG